MCTGAEAAIGMQSGGTAMSVMSSMQQADAARLIGQRRKAAADWQAEQLDVNAGQEVAAGQAGAAEQERQGKIVQSDILANAAASGGGASDPTVMNLIARTAGESSYRAAVQSYQGLAASRQLKLQGAAARYGGDMSQADASAAAGAYETHGLATALTGAGSLYSKYWPGTPNTGNADAAAASFGGG